MDSSALRINTNKSSTCAIVLVAGTLLSCTSDPRRLDNSINRLMAANSEKINAIEAKADARLQDGVAESSPSQLSKSPSTVNQPIEGMSFVPADEARDVAGRLAKYALDGGAPVSDSKDQPDVGMRLKLEDAWRQSQISGREILNAQDDYVLSAIRLLVERHLWGPRFFNDTTASVGGGWDDGSHGGVGTLINQLRATQRLPSGGNVEAAWVWNASEQLRETASGRYTQSSELVLRGQVPLLRGAGTVAREELIQAERDLVYAARTFERFRRQFLVNIARDYFQLLQSRSVIMNQERQLGAFQRLEESTKARVDAGRLDSFQKDLTSNQVKQAQAQLANLRESFVLQLERFKLRLGLDPQADVALSDEVTELPDPEIKPDEAARIALEYRLDLQNARDRIDDRRRGLSNAKNDLLPDLNLNGEVSYPTDPNRRRGGADFSEDDIQYQAGVTLSLPLDRETERLSARRAIVTLQQAARDYELQRDSIVISVRSALRNIELARFQLKLAEEQVEINRRRLKGQELRSDTIDPQSLVDSQNDLLRAENDRDAARTNLRNAILQYLLESDQLRAGRDGALQKLPGM